MFGYGQANTIHCWLKTPRRGVRVSSGRQCRQMETGVFIHAIRENKVRAVMRAYKASNKLPICWTQIQKERLSSYLYARKA